MGAYQLGWLFGAFLGTGLITSLLVWFLHKFLPPMAAILVGNAVSIGTICVIFPDGPAAALRMYCVPQVVWLGIMLVTSRGRQQDRLAPAGRVEPHFGESAVSQRLSGPSAEIVAAPPSVPSVSEASQALPSIAAPVRPPRTGNFVLNHWRGLYPLGVSYWVFGFIIPVVSALGVMAIQAAFLDDDGYQPVLIFFTVACTWAFLAPVTIWQFVGVWRSATRRAIERHLGGKRALWPEVAKAMLVLGALRSIAVFVASGVPQLRETYRVGFMGDPDLPAYAMRIMRNGTEVEITGGFKYGLTDEFNTLLKASPQIAVVHLDSVGGRIGEATKLNKVIRKAGLKTYVPHLCASACTLAFAGGTERWMRQSGVLGFHGPAFPGMSQRELDATNDAQRDLMVSSGYDASFVSRALAVPSKDLWEPTIKELWAARVITGVANGRQFAQSGYGGKVEKDQFADVLGEKIPILAPLREKYPADFSAVVEIYYKGYVDGLSEEDNNDNVRRQSYQAVRKYTRSTGDAPVIELGRLLLDELMILRDRNAGQCAKFGNFGGGDPNIQYSFPKEIMARFQAAGAHVIETSTGTPIEDKEQIVALLKRTLTEMSGQFPESQLALLPGGHPTAQQAPEYCTAVIGFYRQLLKAPPAEAAAMLRVLMTL